MLTEEELKQKTTKELRMLLAEGYHGAEHMLVLREYESRPDTKAKLAKKRIKKLYGHE